MASQKFGFDVENEIRSTIYKLERECNNTSPSIDIFASQNIYDMSQNISIKTFNNKGSICCSSIIDFFKRPNIDFKDGINTKLIMCEYIQINNNHKKIINIFEMDYTLQVRDILFGKISLDKLKEYCNKIKSFPPKMTSKDILEKFNYKSKKKELQEEYDMKITINPKISKTNKRVQCSINRKLLNFLLQKQYIIQKKGIQINDISFKSTYKSTIRERGSILIKYNLLKFCRQDKIKYKGFSNKKIKELIDFIIDKHKYINSKKDLINTIKEMNKNK